MQQKEHYEFERDRPGPTIVKEQFEKIKEQRALRIQIDTKKAEMNKRLQNMKDFIKHYE